MRRALFSAFCALLFAACASLAPVAPQAVSPAELKAYEVSLASSGDALAIAWHGGLGDMNSIHVQKLDAEGRPAGALWRLTDGVRDGFEPDLQVLKDGYLIAWYEKDKTDKSMTAWLARLDAAGAVVWKKQLSGEGGSARNPVVRVGRDEIATAWIETTPASSPAVWSMRFGLDGAPRGSAPRAGEASPTTWNLNAALDADGALYVVYDAPTHGRVSELQMLTIKDGRASHASLSEQDGHASVYPDIAINASGQAALTWFDAKDGNEEVYLAVRPLSEIAAGRLGEVHRITNTPTSSIGAYLAWNGDRLALVWCDSQEGQQELYAGTFDASGRPLTGTQRLTQTPLQSSIPSVRTWGRGFAVGWNEYESGKDLTHMSIVQSHAWVTFLK